ncbi:hypothetical protein KAU09_02825 [Candidatus Parcubacteria bacterium]|nr:hypothetical protein [Candidatus Parcubacteria bacterium]
MLKKFLILILIFLINFLAIPIKIIAQEEECANALINFVVRNANGDFVPNISVEVYEQIYDADNNPKYGLKVSSGKTSAITGFFSAIIKEPKSEHYVYKISHIAKEESVFWFYNNTISCGENSEQSNVLSSIKFILRDADENLMKNESFNLYLQKYDADNEPIKERGNLLATLNTGDKGEVTVYVPSEQESINVNNGYYIFEKTNSNKGVYAVYDIQADAGNETEINYIFSELKLELRDKNDIPFPANEKIEIFEQVEDEDSNDILGEKIKDIYTDDFGIAAFKYPAGIYAARLTGKNGQYTYFWDLEINDQKRSAYALNTNDSWESGDGACSAASIFSLYTKNLDYNLIPGLNYNLYEQITDADGLPAIDEKLDEGIVNENGEGVVTVYPDPRKKYALQIYDKNSSVGDFWYFNEIQFSCGQDIKITKQLPSFNIILRNGHKELVKNHSFSIYTQKYDADDMPIKEKQDLVSSKLNTSEEGMVTIYVSYDHPYDKNKRGTYIIESKGEEGANFIEYDLNINKNENFNLNYVYSDIILNCKNPDGTVIQDEMINLYEQKRSANGEYILGKKLKSAKTDVRGNARFEYPNGYYAAAVKDYLGKDNSFWNINIKNRTRNTFNLVKNNTRIIIKNGSNETLAGKTVNIYELIENDNGYFVKGKKLKTASSKENSINISLTPNPYLFTVIDDKIEYGQVLYAENNKNQTVIIQFANNQIISPDKKFQLAVPEISYSLGDKLSGRILLQVESRGEAWYVDTASRKRYYMKDGETAYEMLRKFGLGITNEDLNKIPIGLDNRFDEWDYDGDLIPDKMEEALGTDMYDRDSDGDGYDDGEEVLGSYNPLGAGKTEINNTLTGKLKGKILLQVESRGEAWYLNPDDRRRYYMKDGESAYEIMRFLSLGITDENLEKIESGTVGD